MRILEIYKKYQIMPQLAEHQLTVAAVAAFICFNWGRQTARNLTPNSAETILYVDRKNIVAACLLHDMGNIVKFDLAKTQALYPLIFKKPEDLLVWEKVKQEFIGRYGIGSHNVTAKIVAELGVNERIGELADSVGFEQGADNAATDDFGKKICAYSDMRVMPQGVVSLEDRMADLRLRYKNYPEGANNREVFEAALRKIQGQIFERCSIRPEDITETAIAGRKGGLKNFEI